MNLQEMLAKAYAPAKSTTRKVESKQVHETDSFDELEDFIDDVNLTQNEPNFNVGISKDGHQLQVGDPVTGINAGREMSGQVIAIQNEMVTVEWKDRTKSNVRANQLTLTNVDDDYELQTMYIETNEQPYMGFDKEAFHEDTDLDSLLKGRPGEVTSYGNISSDF